MTTWWNAHPRERQRVFAVTGIAFAVIAASGLGIAKLVDDVFGGDGATRVDPTITNYVVDHRTAALTTMARGVTHLADPLLVTIVAVISVVALLARRRRRLAGFVALSMAGAALATSLGKLVVDRPRPSDTIWLTGASGAAFPSGHATQSVACWCALAVCAAMLTHRRFLRLAWIALGVVVALAIGASRVYLGVHWTSDVVCGWAVATAWLLALVVIGWSRPRLTVEIDAARDRVRATIHTVRSLPRRSKRSDQSTAPD